MTAYFWETSEKAILAKKSKKDRTTLVAVAITTESVIKKRQQIAELTENIPSCNYCVATIVARPLRTTVKGGRQPSGLRRNQAYVLDSVDSRIREGFGTENFIVLY